MSFSFEKPHKLSKNPVHLGLGATALTEPEFTGKEWYADYGERHAADGKESRLVSMHTFDEPWDSWEMHPEGSEVVICTEGEITLIQEKNGQQNNVGTRAIRHQRTRRVAYGIGTKIRKR